ncbi:MAG: RrF2 family transcriptional regulator [Verrucomicrobiales bacterium]
MRLTKRGEYALRTLIRLGLAERMGRDVVSVATLAECEKLPFKFLEQILIVLRQAGYVETRRGKQGGCRLARPMNTIPIGEVVRLIDGRLAPIGCASETDYAACTCPDETHCGLRMLMIDVRNAIASILDRYTLADVVAVTLRKMERDGLVPKVEVAVPSRRRRGGAKMADPADGLLSWLTGKPLLELT